MKHNRVSSVVNALLRLLGARVVRLPKNGTRVFVPISEHEAMTRELHDCLKALRFPGLPPREGRVPLLTQLVGTNVVEAMWVISALHESIGLAGDVCEFGVAQGATSALLANEIQPTEKRLWLFDSFKGLSKPTKEDVLIDDIFGLGSMEAYEGKMSVSVAAVQQRLAKIGFPPSRYSIVEGFIEESLRKASLPASVCFAYVDFDFYQPIRDALSFLRAVLSPGGSVVVDDYGFFSAGAQQAVDEFAKANASTFQLEIAPTWAGRFAVLRKAPPGDAHGARRKAGSK